MRTYYRLSLSVVCALAATAGPIVFLADQPRMGYLLGGMGAALMTWVFLAIVMAAEPAVHPGLQAILGATAAVPTWAVISLVAVFDVIPQLIGHRMGRFDPVWVMGGLSPLIIPIAAIPLWTQTRRRFWEALAAAAYRFSLPLFGLEMIYRLAELPKQFRSLFLFTGIMFLVLDGLGTGDEVPFLSTRGKRRRA